MAKKSAKPESAPVLPPEADAIKIAPSQMREIIALSGKKPPQKEDEKAKPYKGGADLIEFLRMGWRG